MKPVLISVVGPTAVGKTALAIELAQMLKTEVISTDSRQVYREMEIGTAKPTKEELAMVKHHFINSHSIEEEYSAGQYERDALDLTKELFKTYPKLIAVGGSGLYIKALCEGFDEMPSINPNIRKELNASFDANGLKELLHELERCDPEYHKVVDHRNHQRVIRALEVIRGTGEPFSTYRNKKTAIKRPFEVIKVGVQLERDVLNERIDQRMDQMIAAGLFEEAADLFPLRHLNALQTVGYREIFEFMEGKYDRDEAIRLLKRNSKRYAKRQMTWFRADKEIEWFDAKTSANDILVSLQLP